jgi:hypothetical protein
MRRDRSGSFWAHRRPIRRLYPSFGDFAGAVGTELGGAGEQLAFHRAAEAARRERRHGRRDSTVHEPAERAAANPLEVVAAEVGDDPQVRDAQSDPALPIGVEAGVRTTPGGGRLGGEKRRRGEGGERGGKEDAQGSDGGGLNDRNRDRGR